LNSCCNECDVFKKIIGDKKYEIKLKCWQCVHCGAGLFEDRVELDLRPILTRYFDY